MKNILVVAVALIPRIKEWIVAVFAWNTINNDSISIRFLTTISRRKLSIIDLNNIVYILTVKRDTHENVETWPEDCAESLIFVTFFVL